MALSVVFYGNKTQGVFVVCDVGQLHALKAVYVFGVNARIHH